MSGVGEVAVLQTRKRTWVNQRKGTLAMVIFAAVVLVVIVIAGNLCTDAAVQTSMLEKEIAPCLEHPFGTDWVGRDMFARTLKGMSLSIEIGFAAALLSTVIAAILGSAAGLVGGKVDSVISVLTDTCMGIPHILLLVLVSYALGGGAFGVTIAVAVSHWPTLTRVVRGEILQVKEANYVRIAEQLGQSRMQIACRHMLPHIWNQLFVGFVLMFPHAILHEASVTFLGFGMGADQPAIGRILQESMKYLVLGEWWLAIYPGIALLLVVLLFDALGSGISRLMDPHHGQE